MNSAFFDRLAASLDLPDESPSFDPRELAATWRDPDAFHAAALDALAQRSGPLASRPGVSVHLYADTVARHVRAQHPAVVVYHPRLGWRSLGYAELDRKATARANAWQAQGLQAGARVALALPVGPELFVAWCAALRLGLRVTLLPPDGPALLARRLEALKPDRVVVDPLAPPAIDRAWLALALAPAESAPPVVLPAHAYAPGEPCAELVSPLHDPIAATPLTASQALLAAARDATLTWRLRAGGAFAAPFAHPLQQLPALWTATTLMGATWVHVPDDALRADPSLLGQVPLDAALLNNEAREVLQDVPIARAERWTRWFRPVEEPLDWPAWRRFVERQKLTRVPGVNVLVDSATGGAVLASTSRPGSVSARVLPVAGQPWALEEVGASRRTVENAGVFVALREEKPLFAPWFLVGALGDEQLYGGTLHARRRGRIFPEALVVELARALPFCKGAAVVALPEQPGDDRFALCVLTGAERVAPEVVARFGDALRERLGADGAPDVVDMLPGHPRGERAEPDAAWVRWQYRAGLLQRKARSPVFARLRALREAL